VLKVKESLKNWMEQTLILNQIFEKFLAFYGTHRFLLAWSKAPTNDP
jgi:hypothetical protein